MKQCTVDEMIADLQTLSDRGMGNYPVGIYCDNCDCTDKYTGATAARQEVQITINRDV